jgi:PAS domain S-box-containing protein
MVGERDSLELSERASDIGASLRTVLDCVAQPVWVVDLEGLIRFANPAAIAALGYDDLSELWGKPSHETIHYKHPDGSPFPVEDCPMLAPRMTGETIHSDEDWFVRRDGSMFPVSYWSAPIDMHDGRGAVVAFTDIEKSRRIEDALREHDAILAAVEQPVYLSQDGVIRYVNPAGVRAMGYEDASEMEGKVGHWLVHYKRPDGSHYPIEECLLREAALQGKPLTAGEDWWVRKDGSMIPVSYTAAPVEIAHGQGLVVAFTDLSDRRAMEEAARERDVAEARARELEASEARQRAILEAALDCVISIDEAGCITYMNAAAEETFGYRAADVVGHEMAELMIPPALREQHRQGLARYLSTGEGPVIDRRVELTAMRSDGSEFPVELTVTRVDASTGLVFTGYVRDITERKRAEADLIEARNRADLIANEQAALRRVATLVARGAPSDEVFHAVCEEAGRLVGATSVNLAYFTADGFNLTMAGWSLHETHVPPGTRLPLDGETINVIVQRTKAPARVESYEGVPGELAAVLRGLGIKSEIGAPVVIDGNVWGALIAGWDESGTVPDNSESRIAGFAELIATAVANAEARSDLIAARRRVIEAGDAARRRVTRDLHDGAQQLLVTAIINLQLAQQKLAADPKEAKELLDRGVEQAGDGIDDLRELAAGIHPAILTNRGLSAALEALAATMPLPVRLDLSVDKLPRSIEASVYFFCSEALTNVVKHAQASVADVCISCVGDQLSVEVRDDGVGGADPGHGSGLAGLADRVEALDGRLTLASAPGSGTSLRAEIRLPAGSDDG